MSDTFNPAKLQEAVFVAYENTVVTDYNPETGRCYLNGYWHEVHAPTETDPFGRPICYQIWKEVPVNTETREQRFISLWLSGLITDQELEAALAGLR